MRKNNFLVCFAVLVIGFFSIAWNSCPPASLIVNPNPIIVEGVASTSCIVEASDVSLNLNESWSRKVELEEGQSYWFSASKCARARSLKSEVKDDKGKILGSDSGSKIGFCFKAPKTGTYTISYSVTELNGYSYAVTDACLSKSKCSP